MDEKNNDLGEHFRALYEAVESLKSFDGLTKDSPIGELIQMGMTKDVDGAKEWAQNTTLSDLMGLDKMKNGTGNKQRTTPDGEVIEEVTGTVVGASGSDTDEKKPGQEKIDEYKDMPLMELFQNLGNFVPPDKK